MSSVKDLSIKIIDASHNIPSEAAIAIKNIKNSSFAINFVSSNMNIALAEKQLLLEEIDLKKRAISALEILTKELQMLEMKNKIQSIQLIRSATERIFFESTNESHSRRTRGGSQQSRRNA